MKPQAVIFDLDGVITDTAHLHFVAWRSVAQEIGIAIDETFNAELKGISRMASLLKILQFGGKEGDFSDKQCLALAGKKNDLYVASLAALTQESLLPGVNDVLADIRRAGVKIGLASVSLNAPTILHALGIRGVFDFCADASRILCSKPDPEIFLEACKGLNVAPHSAIGIEDAAAGVEAINAAGMLSVGIGENLPHARLQLSSTRELTWQCLSDFWTAQRRSAAN